MALAVNLHRTRARTLRELAELVAPYFREVAYDPEAAAKFLKDPALPGHLEALRDRYAQLPDFTKESTDAALRALADERGLKAGALIHPTRMALSGAAGGPPLFDLVEAMGCEAATGHFDRFLAFLKAGNTAQPAQG
jgi:glutamyl-tRNA synthetase